MFEIAARVVPRIDAGERVVIATAIEVIGSAPRTVGTSMAVTGAGDVIGSISGGCVEGAVYELCQRVLETGITEVESFGFDEEEGFAAGLSCGGRIRVLAELVTSAGESESESDIESEIGTTGRTGDEADAHATLAALRRAAAGEAVTCTLVDAAGAGLLTESYAPGARFLIFGAVEFSVALAAAAAVLGYRVTVCDARPVFATADRFPGAEEVVVEWPTGYLARTEVDARTVICILTHDERFDVDLIEAALARGVAYVGAMGSRSTHELRVADLARRGITDLTALHSPIGLDLGASTPEETAISILAEVLAERTGSSGARLVEVTGAIHRPNQLQS